jgi:hypothetical protein
LALLFAPVAAIQIDSYRGIGTGSLATAVTRGIGTGSLATAEWVVSAFNPIALVKTDNANTATTSHLFISPPYKIYTVELMSGLVPFRVKIRGVCLNSTPLASLGLLGQSLAKLSRTN